MYSIYNFLKFRKYIFIVRFLFALSFVFLIVLPGNAQEGASIGIKLGTGFSRYYFAIDPGLNSPISQDFVPVYEAGFVFFHQTAKAAGIQIEVQYAQKAWQEKFDNGTKRQVLIHYLEIPVLTHIKLPFKSKKSAMIINFGFYGAYAYEADIKSFGKAIDTTLIQYNEFLYNTIDYGLKGGFGYEMKLGAGSIQLQAMYSQALQDLFERDRLKIYRSLNQSLFVSAIYKIPLARKKIKSKK